MKKITLLFFICCLHFIASANDGAFFASGNHLIPITETDIAIKKEILTLKKIRNQFLEVTVYYEFFNPKEEKNIIVGFEAFSPYGDVNGTPKNGLHPYMRDFTVNLNNQILKYKVAYVNDSLYAQSGKINSKKLEDIKNNIENENVVDFYYVYHFDAKFKKGINIIKHTYNYDLSGSVDYDYDFEYILTAANRWSNKQIDDFTLIVDMGEFESFNISKTFFNKQNQWIINGIGKSEDITGQKNGFIENDGVKFNLQKGNLVFQQLNFKPQGELFLYSLRHLYTGEFFDATTSLPFSYYQQDKISTPNNELSKKILKNLPFARRGYIFSNKELQQYYETMTDWYIPNPNYSPETPLLSDIEKEWIKKWK